MAQIIPPITSLPIDSSAAPSVEDIQDRLPSICVDYLSHDWSEEDVWASWRNMTRHKHEIANGVRLENASWRTWQKQRNNLKTISPETLNWLKDSDVTWLYGPLHTANVEPVRPLKVSSTGERLGLDVTSTGGPPGPRPSKPILKHRTLSEMLSITTPSSPVMEADTPEGEVDGLDQARPMLATTKSDTNIFTTRPGMAIRRTSPTLPMGAFPSGNQGQGAAGGAGQKSPNAPGTRTPTEGNPPSSGKEKKHISFNTFVEQCIAVDDPSARENNMWQESEDDDMLEMRSHRSSSSKSSRPSISRHSSSSSTRSQQEPLTIAKIAPTMLKTQTYANSEQLPQMVYQPPPQYLSPQISPGVHSPVGPSSYSSQASTASTGSTGTAQGKKWDDDDGQPYDYFGGPDRSSGPAQGSGQVAQAQSPAQNIPQRAPAPVVAQPPQQPKWRQGQQQQQQQVGSIDSTLSTSASSSSSSSSLARDNITSPPQPSRSILKQRSVAADASNTAEADFDSGSPPGNYFNYNPSAATGIGGMRAAQYLDQNPSGQGGNASPLVSPATGEERGRSTARGGTGTSQYDRSISRSTNSSAGSVTGGANSGAGGNASGQGPMSPGTSRSPSGSTHGHATSGVSKKGPAQQQAQQQKVHAAQQANTQAQQQQQQRQAEVAAEADNGMEIDHDESPDRGASTPTPHSSPQILFRPLQDTSPASLPHVSTSLASLPHASYPAPPSRSPRSPHASPPTSGEASPETPLSPYASRNPSSPVASHLPRADEPKATSPPSGPPLAVGTAASGSAGSDAARHARGMGGKATTASIGTMAAAPHIYQNATASNRTARTGQGRPQGQAQTQGLGLGQAIDTPGKSAPMGSTTTGQAQAQAQRNYEQFPPPTSATTSTAPASSSSATLSTGNTGAHAGTNASTSTSTGTGAGINRWVRPNTTAYPDHFPRSGVEDDEDGGSIMGRAANIASTARDLFGALWYGAHGAGGSGLVSGQVSGRDASYAGRQIHAQAQAQAQAQIPGQAQAPGHEQGQGPPRREEQQAIDHRVAEQSARRGGRHTRGKSIG